MPAASSCPVHCLHITAAAALTHDRASLAGNGKGVPPPKRAARVYQIIKSGHQDAGRVRCGDAKHQLAMHLLLRVLYTRWSRSCCVSVLSAARRRGPPLLLENSFSFNFLCVLFAHNLWATRPKSLDDRRKKKIHNSRTASYACAESAHRRISRSSGFRSTPGAERQSDTWGAI